MGTLGRAMNWLLKTFKPVLELLVWMDWTKGHLEKYTFAEAKRP
jgi:hypothetical protein